METNHTMEEILCDKCIEHMERIDVTPVGIRGIIELYECPSCGETFEVVKKLEKMDESLESK